MMVFLERCTLVVIVVATLILFAVPASSRHKPKILGVWLVAFAIFWTLMLVSDISGSGCTP